MIVGVEGKQILIMKIMIVITDGANNGWSIEGTKARIVMVTTMTETIKLQITGKITLLCIIPFFRHQRLRARRCGHALCFESVVQPGGKNYKDHTITIWAMKIVYFFFLQGISWRPSGTAGWSGALDVVASTMKTL